MTRYVPKADPAINFVDCNDQIGNLNEPQLEIKLWIPSFETFATLFGSFLRVQALLRSQFYRLRWG